MDLLPDEQVRLPKHIRHLLICCQRVDWPEDGYQWHDDNDHDGGDDEDVRPDICEHLGQPYVGSQKVELVLCLRNHIVSVATRNIQQHINVEEDLTPA